VLSSDKESKKQSDSKSKKGSKSPSKKSHISSESSEEDKSDDDMKGEDTIDEMKDLPSHSEMKKELINAILQAMKEKEERMG